MSDPSGEAQRLSELTDFVAAARLLRCGSAEAAMVRLLPLHLTEHELLLRVHLMVAAGAVATTPLGPTDVQDLIAAHHTEPIDMLVDLVGLFARLDRSDG